MWDGHNAWLYLGRPNNLNATKINVTMVLKIGMAIANKEYDEIEYEQFQCNP